MALDERPAVAEDAQDLVIAIEYPGEDRPEYIFYLYVHLQAHLVRRAVAELPPQPQVGKIARRVIELDASTLVKTQSACFLQMEITGHSTKGGGNFVRVFIHRQTGYLPDRD